jgi:hypothetical protein
MKEHDMGRHRAMRKRHQAQREKYLKGNIFHASNNSQFMAGIKDRGVSLRKDVVKMIDVGWYLFADRAKG